jgi:hypothetical protein
MIYKNRSKSTYNWLVIQYNLDASIVACKLGFIQIKGPFGKILAFCKKKFWLWLLRSGFIEEKRKQLFVTMDGKEIAMYLVGVFLATML